MLTIFLLIIIFAIVVGAAYAIVNNWGGGGTYLPPQLPPPPLPPAPPSESPPAPRIKPRVPPVTPGRNFRVKTVNRHGTEIKPEIAPKPAAGVNGLKKMRKLVNLDAICNRTGRVVRECKCDDCRVLREQHGIG
ncbi:MAG TPA: hypothetical protein VD835_01000 [Pyrinomonadaceae bacterium]|nr:hypothetical protein [Pyrinomonadaceae bacterium]